MSYLSKSIQKLISSSPKTAIKFMTSMSSEYWEKSAKAKAISTFRKTAKTTVGYKKLLQDQSVDIRSIKNINYFKKLPIIDKDNYIRKTSLADIANCPLEEAMTTTASSGSSGKPIYFFSSREEMAAYPKGMATFFDYYWDIVTKKKKTLFINAMAPGMWMGSVFGNYVFAQMCKKNKTFSYVSCGTEIDRILEVLELVGKRYDLIIITTYPSFLKTVIDSANKKDIDLKKYNIKFISSGELLDDSLRKYFTDNLCDKIQDRLTTVFDIYGGTEIGNPGMMSPLAYVIKEKCKKNKKFALEIFGNENASGAFFQITPSAYVEVIDEHLVYTKDGMIPLVRYDSKDCGRIITWKEMVKILKKYGISMSDELKKYHWHKPSFKWPFVVLLGRADWAISFFGAMVSPESIKHIMHEYSFIRSYKISAKTLTGQSLQFNVFVELQPYGKIKKSDQGKLSREISQKILSFLVEKNFDFNDAYKIYQKALVPQIKFVEFNTGIFKGEIDAKPPLVTR